MFRKMETYRETPITEKTDSTNKNKKHNNKYKIPKLPRESFLKPHINLVLGASYV